MKTRFWCDLQKKSLNCVFLQMLGAIFAWIFRDFTQISSDFAQIVRDSAQFFKHQNFWGALHPCTPASYTTEPRMRFRRFVKKSLTKLIS